MDEELLGCADDEVSKALAREIARSETLIKAAELVLKHVSPRDKEVCPSFQKLEDTLKKHLMAKDVLKNLLTPDPDNYRLS